MMKDYVNQMYRVRAGGSALFQRRRYRPLEEVPIEVYAELSEAERAQCEECKRPEPPPEAAPPPAPYVALARKHVRVVPPEQNKPNPEEE